MIIGKKFPEKCPQMKVIMKLVTKAEIKRQYKGERSECDSEIGSLTTEF